MTTNHFDNHLVVAPTLITEALEALIAREAPIGHFAELFGRSEDFESELASLSAMTVESQNVLYVVVDDEDNQATLAKAVEANLNLLNRAKQSGVYFIFVGNHPPAPASISEQFHRYASATTRLALGSFAARKDLAAAT